MQWQRDIEENFKVGIIDFLILKMLSKEDMYGYQIKLAMNRMSEGRINIKEGSLYGPLYRLENKKLVVHGKLNMVYLLNVE